MNEVFLLNLIHCVLNFWLVHEILMNYAAMSGSINSKLILIYDINVFFKLGKMIKCPI